MSLLLLFNGTTPVEPPPPPPPALSTDMPALGVFIAFASSPRQIPVWTDVSSRLRELSVRRGRSYELDRVEAGTCSLRLANRDRALDPTNTSSPYYPNVKPMRRLHITAVWNNVTYDLFSGYIERWPPRRNGKYDSEVEIEASDAFAALAAVDKVAVDGPLVYGATTPGSRIVQVLSEINWPANDMVVSPGSSLIDDLIVEQGDSFNVLDHLQEVADAEQGVLFANAAGQIVFRDRASRLTINSSTTSQGTFGDNGTTEIPYVSLEPSYDVDRIYNTVSISIPSDPMPAVASDTTSDNDFFTRTLSRSVPLGSWEEALSQAQWILSRTKDPIERFESMGLKPRMAPSLLWPQVLGREIGNRITVNHRPPPSGLISTDQFIEGVEMHFQGMSAEATWQLSPASRDAYWIWDSTTASVWDVSSRWSY